MSEFLDNFPAVKKHLTKTTCRNGYHISIGDGLPEKVTPRVTSSGYDVTRETRDIPRVSVADHLLDVFGGLGRFFFDSDLEVGAKGIYRFGGQECYKPSKSILADADDHNELWLLPNASYYTPELVGTVKKVSYYSSAELPDIKHVVLKLELTDSVVISDEVTLPEGVHYLHLKFGTYADQGYKEVMKITVELMGVKEDEFEVSIESNSKTKKLYVFLTDTGTAFGNVIKKVTKTPYGHASIALNSDLDPLYSYNLSEGGFSTETLDEYYGRPYTLWSVEVDEEQYQAARNYIANMDAHKGDSDYSIASALNALFKKDIFKRGEKHLSAICSEFVANVLAEANVELYKSGRRSLQPYEIVKSRKLKHERRGVVKSPKPKYM